MMRSKNTHEKIRILQNSVSKKILSACSNEPKSVTEISKIQGIPLAKCYRMVTELEEKGYIEVAQKLLTNGKEVCLYKTMIDLKFISHGDGKETLKVDLEDIREKDHKPSTG